MKILSIIGIVLLAAALGLGAGYLVQHHPLGERANAAKVNATVRTGDFTRIQARVDSRVVLYTIATCPYCKRAKELLAEHGVRYAELPLDTSLAAREEAKSLGATQVPFILIGSNSIEGFDEAKLLAVLDQQEVL
jgi:glutaredoxin 3